MREINYKLNKMQIVFRQDGRYFGRITVKGKRKDFYGATKSEVKQKAREYLLKVENGFTDAKRIRFDDYMIYWLENFKWNYIEPSSYTRLYRTYQCQIKPVLGSVMIGDITREMVQDMIDEHANPTKVGTTPLARSGLKKLAQLMNAVMRKAVEQGVISSNPCDGLLIPVESCIQVETKHQITMDDEQIEEFKEACLSRYKSSGEYKSRDYFILLLILNLGLRVGEALALEWSDIDLTKKLVYIRKTIQSNIMTDKNNISNVSSRVKYSTKTSAGVRVIKLNEKVLCYIRELKLYDERNKINSIYVCSTRVGTRNSARNLQRSLDRLVENTTIKDRITLHTLRHTFGSTMLRRGVPIEVVSKLMGHANITITYTQYIHILQEQQALAMDMVQIC